MPPTIGGVSVPYDSGQSGTESAASFDVTNAPAISRMNVQIARNTAKRCVPGLYVVVIRRNLAADYSAASTLLPSSRNGAADRLLRLPFCALCASVLKVFHPILVPEELANCPA